MGTVRSESKPQVKSKIAFPKGFLLGAASAAHQVEGNNINSDWWQAETAGKVPKSGQAADHYNRFQEDFKIAHDIGLNAMRISIEWARIEPTEGHWDQAAVEHYKTVLKSMKDQGLTRMVTLHHYTLPQWFSDKGGFEKRQSAESFARFAWFVAQNLGSEIDLWITINEPETYCQQSFLQGKYPPFKRSNLVYYRVLKNLVLAHKKAYKAIKSAYAQAQIGIAKNLSYYEADRKYNFLDQMLVFFSTNIGNNYFYEKIAKQMDFIGINYYFYNRVRFDFLHGYKEMNLNFMQGQMELADQERRSDMGWFLYPEGVYRLIKQMKRYHLPIYITENGLADAADSRRPKFLRETLMWMAKAITEGHDVRGYFYWALTDNYEWVSGFGPRFGLVEIDYATQKRTIRKSVAILKEVEIDT